MKQDQYVIRGGVEGRERLRIMSQFLRPGTLALLERAGVAPGWQCLDVGCGGGDVTLELARIIGADGRAVGIDIDAEKLGIAKAEASDQGVDNVEFRQVDVADLDGGESYDLVYARFLLTHLSDPAGTLAAMKAALKPDGTIIVEDIDTSAQFCYPDSQPFRRYMELYAAIVRNRDGDPHIGKRIPSLLQEAGFDDVEPYVVQPVTFKGDIKAVSAITMEAIADVVIADGLADKAELDALIDDLYSIAADETVLTSGPRIVQAWGRKSSD